MSRFEWVDEVTLIDVERIIMIKESGEVVKLFLDDGQTVHMYGKAEQVLKRLGLS